MVRNWKQDRKEPQGVHKNNLARLGTVLNRKHTDKIKNTQGLIGKEYQREFTELRPEKSN